MGFRWPHRWPIIAKDAFDATLVDHDAHGFSPLFVAEQDDRDRYLEDYLDMLSSGGAPPVFDWPGPVVISVTDLFPVTSARQYTTAYLTAVAAGTATVAIYKNGLIVGSTFNMPAGTTSTSLSFPVTVLPGDYLQGRVTASGGGLVGLAVALG